MNIQTRVKTALSVAILAAITGCSTPESRIKKNPELFEQLAPEVQAAVKLGRIDVGFPRDAVQLAMGTPNRQYSRRVAGGKTVEVWSYTTTKIDYDRQRADIRVQAYDRNGKPRTYTDSTWVDVEQKTEFERLRVELENGLVTAIETLER